MALFAYSKKSRNFVQSKNQLVMDALFGRGEECRRIDSLLYSDKAEFIALYGRRRVGKTYLIDEYLKNRIAFKVSGVLNQGTQAQMSAFRIALDKQGYPEPKEHTSLFLPQELKELIDLDVMTMTPIEALNKLYDLQQQVKKSTGN